MLPQPDGRASLSRLLALNRTVGVVLLSVLFFGLGEHLWSQFMPVLLKDQSKELAREAQLSDGVTWAALWAVGVYACLRNLFEGFCYIGGGQLTARLGDRGSLMAFGGLTVIGYVCLLLSNQPMLAILAAMLILGWEPLSVPATFTTVGSTVGLKSQGMAFALQSIQKRLPKIIGPVIAGFLLGAAKDWGATEEAGREAGMRVLVGAALVLGLISLAVQWRWMPHREPPPPGPPAWHILRDLHPTLRRLLVAEVTTRWCDWLVREYVVIYLMAVHGISAERVGLLLGLQNLVALLTYLPIGQMTGRFGLQPFIGLTFVFFAMFPFVLAIVPDSWLPLAFIVYGLREIGEPARKALITSLMPEPVRARGVGLYWGVRSFAICTASLAGAVIWWEFGPVFLLYTAFVVGCIGTGVFYLFCRPSVRLSGKAVETEPPGLSESQAV